MDPEPADAPAARGRARAARRARPPAGRGQVVVVAYDGTVTSRPALRWAALEARRSGSRLRVVSVTEHAALLRGPSAELVASWEQARDDAGQMAAAGASLAATLAQGVDVEAVARVGGPAAAIAAESRRAAALVLSPEAFADAAEQLRPDMAVSAQVWAVLARRSRGPVVLVRGTSEAPGPAVPVVVGVDGSPEGARAAELAARLAAGSRAPLRIVCAWVPVIERRLRGTGWGLIGRVRHDPTSPARAHAVIAETAERVRGLLPDQSIETVVDSGSAEPVLARASSAAGVLVLGRRGHGAQHSLVLGSVSARALRTVGVPLALVPAAPA